VGFMDTWRRLQAFGICHQISKYFVNLWLTSPDAHISVDTAPRIFPNAGKPFSITRKPTGVCSPARPSQMNFRGWAIVHSLAKSAPTKAQPAQPSPKPDQASDLRTQDELSHALAIEIGSPNLKTKNAPPEEAFLVYCQRLVSVDKKTSKGRLIHFIPQEYPGAHPELLGTALYSGRDLLKFNKLPELPPVQSPFNQSSSRSPGHAFSRLLLSILRNARKKRPFRFHESSRSKLFEGYNNHIPTKLFLKSQEPYSPTVAFNKLSLFSSLRYESVFEIVKIPDGLGEVEGCDIN